MNKMSKALQREAELVAKARATREEYARVSLDYTPKSVPINLEVIYSLAKYQYFMYQSFKGEDSGYWISKKAIAHCKAEIERYKSHIKAGEHEERAKEAAEEALELLALITKHRIRQPKTRVY